MEHETAPVDINLKKELIQILSVIKDFCDKNNIRYFLAYGTLLGSIRHKGFIPWDDDIDLWMPRPDYLTFINTFKHDIYQFHCPEKDPRWPLNYGKVCDERFSAMDQFGNDFGVFVDIFPLDGLPENKISIRVFQKHIRLLEHLWSNQLFSKTLHVSRKNGFTLNLKILTAKLIGLFFPYIAIRKSLDKLYQKYNYDNARQISVLSGRQIVFNKMGFEPCIFSNFEGLQCRIPNDYHLFLTMLYEDYMTPPKDVSSTHGLVLKRKGELQKEPLTY